MKITKREVIFSIALICVMFIIGIVLSDKINDGLMAQYQKYNTALQINDDPELFRYGMRTNVGNAFVHGDLAAVDPVSYPEVDGLYGSMTKVTERYTRHTRTVTTKDSNGHTHTRTEVYWTWDAIGREYRNATTISYLGVEFPYGTIDYFPENYITTIKISSNLRDKYYGSDISYTGTLFANLSDNMISQTSFYNDMTIEKTIEHLETKIQLVIFWIFWIGLTIVATYGFYYLDNKWLEG